MTSSLEILGIGRQSAGRTRGAVTITLTSIHDPTSSVTLLAFILKELTSSLPSFSASGSWQHLQGVPLADPDFLTPGPIDAIIGADSYGLLVQSEVVKGQASDPIGQRTLLGWIVLGPVDTSTSDSIRVQHSSTDDDVSSLLRKFWEQEEIPLASASTPETEASSCEQHFRDAHSRDSSGRYTVRLPFKASTSTLGDSLKAANRFISLLQSRLSKNSEYSELYHGFLHENEALGHMSRASTLLPSTPVYYLPHHGVFRAHSATTKLRVVFNGSCKTSSGVSLNDILHTGEKLQQDTSDVLLWIRRHRFIFATDITKMYRQILVHPDDRDFQRILWVDSSERIVPYCLTTVTYGLSCAPFLAIRVMQQLVEDEGHNFPLAVLPLTKGRYVDDIFGGAETTAELQRIALQLTEMCERGCFPLQKWASNSDTLLPMVNSTGPQSEAVPIQPDDASTKLLGLVWNSNLDLFRFTLQPSFNATVTKRTILSETAQLFEPLGFISPVIITAKMFLQELCLAKLQWDDPLPASLHERWLHFRDNLTDLSLVSLPRWLHFTPSSTVELHGFSDASQLAMAAVVYLRTTSLAGSSTVTLVCSKTKVAPLKRLTIPRLELTAALLLARLLSYVQRTLELHEVPAFLWTDTSVSLTWITSHPSRWKDFVQNRVTSIQELTSHAKWGFISGKENPADCASRGLSPRQLSRHPLWWNGPSWLVQHRSNWPTPSFDTNQLSDLEQRPGLSFCQRAVSRFQRVPSSSLATPLTPEDLDKAKLFWIRITQTAHFTTEQQILSSGTAQVTPSRAFLHTGLDYARPFTVKTWRGRAAKTYKAYLAVFVCFSTSAVHFELVTDYTSEAFIAAYRRFSGRRGVCHTLYSDCGTNFIGADKILQALFTSGSAELRRTISSLTNLGTKWSFNPPSAPHMGGKWEAAVKSAKHHLRRVIGETVLTYEEFTTLLTQVEAVLNSRPLCPLSDDSEDTSALTPAHFIIGEALTTLPESSLASTSESRLTRWRLLQLKLQTFWTRWSSEYLQRSLSISKWHHPSNEIVVGSLVLITDERLPPSRWPLARVVELHPGLDGLTRVVTLRTASSTFKRPIGKLCVLPMDSSSTDVTEGGEYVQKSPRV